MTIALVGQGAADNGSTSVAPAYPGGNTDDVLLLVAGSGDSGNSIVPDTPAGWTFGATVLGGSGSYANNAGSRRTTVFWREAADGTSGTVTVTAPGADTLLGTVLRFSKTTGTWAVTASASTNKSSASTAFAIDELTALGYAAGDVVTVATGHALDVPSGSGQNITATGATFANVTERSEDVSTLGFDVKVIVTTADVTAGPATAGAHFTSTFTANETGAGVFVRLHESIGGESHTGTAALTGTGALSVVAAAALAATVALSGAGSLGATGSASASGTASLSGAGSLSAAGKPAAAGAASLAGSGTLTTAGTPATTGVAALSGTGSLTASGTASQAGAGTANLSGSGSLSVTGAPHILGTIALSGTGTLAASGVASMPGSGTAALSGSGTLTVAGTPSMVVTVALAGSGSLSATGLPNLAAAASLSGAGTLTATGVNPGAYVDVRVLSVVEHQRQVTITEHPRTVTLTEHPRQVTITDRSA